MTDATLNAAGPVGNQISLGDLAKRVWRMWREAVGGRTDWRVLLVLFTALQLADIVTTNLCLGLPGNWEANPLMALAQADLGALWWLPKAAGVCLICFIAPLIRRRWPMVLAVCYGGLIVSGNLLAL